MSDSSEKSAPPDLRRSTIAPPPSPDTSDSVLTGIPLTLHKKVVFSWCMYDWGNSAFATVILAAVFPVYFLSLVPEEGGSFRFFGIDRIVPASSLWSYAVALSMLLIALLAPYAGRIADERNCRRFLLAFFSLTGATVTVFLSVPRPGDYIASLLIFVVANFCFAAGNVFYNSFLPLIVEENAMDRISSRGFAFGYIGGGLALLLTFLLIAKFELFGFPDKGSATRCGIVLTGLWWGVFSLPAILFLKDPPIPPRAVHPLQGFRNYLKTFRNILSYRDLALFLLAFLFYNDGIQTIIVVSAVFAKESLGLSQINILACFLMIQFLAMPGTVVMGYLAERKGTKRILLIALSIFLAITTYAYSIRTAFEFWVLAAAVGLVFGGCQAISRSLFGRLVPPERTSEFFGFYAISAKFASIIGPFLFGLINHLTGSLRYSILALSVFFLVGIFLLAGVDIERGKARIRGTSP